MRIEEISYVADGRELVGTFAFDDARRGPRPAVLVCHEGPGLDSHAKGRAVRLASLGYAAFALDYHGGGQPLPMEEVMPRLGELRSEPSRLRAIGQAGLEVLLGQDDVDAENVGAIGFCFGGTMVLDLARSGSNLKAVIGFHPGLGMHDVEQARGITASVLMFCGADDSIIGKDARDAFEQEMTDAHVPDWRMEVLGGVGHSFTNILVDQLGMPGLAYDEKAERRCWRTALALLEEKLGPTPG
jgi:dienelactone hydrolase